MYRIRRETDFLYSQCRTFATQNFLHQFDSKLFALVMSKHPYPNFLFVSEIIVIPHFSGQKDVGTLRDSITQEKISRTSAKRYLLYFLLRTTIVLQALYSKFFFYCAQKTAARIEKKE